MSYRGRMRRRTGTSPLLLFSIRTVIAKSGWSKRIGVRSSVGWSGASPGGMIPWRMPGVPARIPRGLWLFDRPVHPAVSTARQQKFLGLLFVDMVERPAVLVGTAAEADQDLVTPRPDPVVGRPARESALLAINDDVLQCCGRVLSQRDERTAHASQSSTSEKSSSMSDCVGRTESNRQAESDNG